MGDILFSIIILPCFFIVFILSGILVKYVPVASQGRYSGIDGLRGYLALMVAVHHFYIFYQWRIGGEWKEPSLVFFNNLGVFAVAVFFMITGFLFIGKIDKASFFNNFDFVGLIKSRLYRIL
ncbi:TPA: acyltransferase family protein, partial [Klebsiella quasipneumoniae]|nr:acyltransferase family protein [Klebsiella quasipneumoniae]